MKTTRKGVLGQKDKKLIASKKILLKSTFVKQSQPSSELNKHNLPQLEYDCIDTSSDEEYIPKNQNSGFKSRQSIFDTKQSELPAEMLFVADKYKCSNRCVTETLAVMHKSRGTNLDDIDLSTVRRDTVRRRREALRQSFSTKIDDEKIEQIVKKLWALHWDGKMLKPLNHAGNKEERLAVLLKSGKEEFLLQIINIEGKIDATKQTNAIILVLN